VIDLLLAAIGFPLIVAVALALLSAVTLVPFVLALQMAETRAFSTARWGAIALVGSLVGLLLMLLFYRSDRIPTLASLLPLVFTWTGPGLLWLLTGEEALVGGRSGAHE
jgi:membrane associated rhomboid family serine protease